MAIPLEFISDFISFLQQNSPEIARRFGDVGSAIGHLFGRLPENAPAVVGGSWQSIIITLTTIGVRRVVIPLSANLIFLRLVPLVPDAIRGTVRFILNFGRGDTRAEDALNAQAQAYRGVANNIQQSGEVLRALAGNFNTEATDLQTQANRVLEVNPTITQGTTALNQVRMQLPRNVSNLNSQREATEAASSALGEFNANLQPHITLWDGSSQWSAQSNRRTAQVIASLGPVEGAVHGNNTRYGNEWQISNIRAQEQAQFRARQQAFPGRAHPYMSRDDTANSQANTRASAGSPNSQTFGKHQKPFGSITMVAMQPGPFTFHTANYIVDYSIIPLSLFPIIILMAISEFKNLSRTNYKIVLSNFFVDFRNHFNIGEEPFEFH